MNRPLHRPTLRQATCLVALAAAALAYGFYVRYALIENSALGIGCTSGLVTWQCATRSTTIALFTPQWFGWVALAAAALNLLRPSVVFWAIVLLAGGAGIVLYNVALSALAIALLTLSLARPVPEAS